MKISKYQIVSAPKNRPLSECVQPELEKDWQPYGYPYLDRNGIEKQAMVMYEELPVITKPELTPFHAPIEVTCDDDEGDWDVPRDNDALGGASSIKNEGEHKAMAEHINENKEASSED